MAEYKKNLLDTLGEVYETMYEHIVLNVHRVEEKTTPLLNELIEEAKKDAVKLGEFTKEETEIVAEELKRELQDMSAYLAENEHQLQDWLGFESALIKETLLENILKAANSSNLQLMALKDRLEKEAIYHTGQIKSPGRLVCDKCGEVLHFHKAGKVPPCPKCHATNFHRGIKP